MDKYTKLGSDGSVDVTASAAAYTAALNKWVSENEIATDSISTAVNAVLDRFPGVRQPMPALLSQVALELNASPDQFKAIQTRAHAFVKGQAGLGLLTITKGKGGGVGRPAAK